MQKPCGVPRHQSWLGVSAHFRPETHAQITLTNRSFILLHMEQGNAQGTWTSRGRQFRADGAAGAVRFHPADGEEHRLSGHAGRHGMRYAMLIVPPDDLRTMASADGIARLPEPHLYEWPNDPVLRGCLPVLTRSGPVEGDEAMADRDRAARMLVLRLAALLGAPEPDWRRDWSRFSSRTLEDLVLFIDTRLRHAPTVVEMASLCRLSPSHFARKFRLSTGLSLHRFINLRRLQASLGMLQRRSTPLAQMALELGFSSQSHFTRLFREMTGMSPGRYRRLFKRPVG